MALYFHVDKNSILYGSCDDFYLKLGIYQQGVKEIESNR